MEVGAWRPPQRSTRPRMPFKIVKTIEKNRPQLCICPSQWESGGLLKWPKKFAEKLMKNEYSIAQPDWQEISCIVKRTTLTSYQAADEELRTMLNNTDTEHEEGPFHQIMFRRNTHRPPDPINLNNIANQLIIQQAENSTNASTVTAHTESGDSYQIIVPGNSATETAASSDPDTLKLIVQNQSILLEVTNSILENQKKIMHELASLSVQIEESISKIRNPLKVQTLTDCIGTAENTSFTIKQIKNVQDLEYMELLLSDNEQKLKLFNASSFICSGGQGTAKNCAFRFIDVLFSRDFLCECSWSGSSRSDSVKVSLKHYKKTLQFFYEMIKGWDGSFTIEDNEKFFKEILKNSNKRRNAKHERISTKRRRTASKKFYMHEFGNEINNSLEMILTDYTEKAIDSNGSAEATNLNPKINNESGENEKGEDQSEDEEEESIC